MVIDTQANNPSVEEVSDLDKLKKQNEDFERELLKARQMRAEKQKIEAELLLSSSAGQQIPIKPAPVETPKEYAEKVLKGEIKAK